MDGSAAPPTSTATIASPRLAPAEACGCLLVVPSAALAPAELQAEFGPVPTGMVPYRGRPAYAHIVEQNDVDAAVIAVSANAAPLCEHVAHAFGTGAACVDVGRTESLGETVCAVLDDWVLRGLPPPRQLRIQFADTLVELDDGAIPDATTIFHGQAVDLFRWTCFTVDDDGAIDRFIEKGADKAGDDVYGVVIGAFAIADVTDFHVRLRMACAAGPAEGVDPFYVALREHYNATPAHRRALRPVRGWTDLGHLDTYYAARRKAGMNARVFNALDVSDRRGVIRKTSANSGKLVDEIRWYLRLPKTLAHLAPRVLDYDLDPVDPFVEMEFYGYPALSDMFLYGAHDGGVWERVMAALGDALDLMASHRYAPADGRTLTTALRAVYQQKTAERIAALPADGLPVLFGGDTVTINGVRRPGLAAMVSQLPRLADAVGLYDCDAFSVVHGDFCLSNLLFDRRNCFLRCIDPRGRFGAFDIYGDPHYDLAKLMHSFVGGYDFLVNGLVRVDVDGRDDIRFATLRQPHHRMVETLFRRWLARRAADALPRIRLIEALLFVSMTPLHADRPQAQVAMMATGLDRFGRLAEEAGIA
ncbi:MAG: phosphotransferase [Alphaproteobacteria bacterium]